MTGDDRLGGDEALALALARGRQVKDAAQEAGVSEATAYRRLRMPVFRDRVGQLRAELVSQVVGRVSALGEQAGNALENLLNSDKPAVKLGAVRTALEYLFKGNEQFTLAQQLEELRRQLEEVKKHGPGNAEPTGAKTAGDHPASGANGQPDVGAHSPGPGQPHADGQPGAGPLADDDPPLFG